MPLGGVEILQDSLVLPINISFINTFYSERSILAIIGIFRRLSKVNRRKVYFF